MLSQWRSKIAEDWHNIITGPPIFSAEWVERMLDADRRTMRLKALRRTVWSLFGNLGYLALLLGMCLSNTFSTEDDTVWRILGCVSFLVLSFGYAGACTLEFTERIILKTIERLSNEGKLHVR